MAANETQSLFDYLLQHSELEYLSDMCQKEKRPQLHEALKHLDGKQYSAEDWSLLASYITGRKLRFKTAAAARRHLLQYTDTAR
ncbi:MAG TPA: hypothetical protein P5185_09400 [Oscillospiraceae bacterium]|nr:hypothetical protein [Oscillospiraceae bacterium]